MGSRSILLSLRDFASRELKEARAERVEVRKVKPSFGMRKGRVPDTRVMTVTGVSYLVCSHRGDALRVFYVDGNGGVLGAEDVPAEKKDETLKIMSKKTKTIIRIKKN